jgi:catechol 2,3-dioxygenase-like lactoylglutathione lyase family enzyme
MGAAGDTHVHRLGQVNLIVSDLERSARFYGRFGWSFRTMGDSAMIAELPGGLLVSLHLPDFAKSWNEGYEGAMGGAAVFDVSLPDRRSVDRLHAEFVADGYRSPQAPMDAFFGPRYAIVEDPDGYLVGLKSPRG